MEGHIFEWLNLSLRWLHMIAGIAWIGASFYFVWLNNHVEKPSRSELEGELWAIHGGAFYFVEKYKVAPGKMPETLHWFKWEAYTTWITGFLLLILLYFWKADLYLIDKNVADLSFTQAILASLGFLLGGWICYDFMCKSPLGKSNLATGIGLALVTALAIFMASHLFSGRGAFMITGAMLGTIMVANVFFTIIPGQAELVRAAEQGRNPDPLPGKKAAQRSFHNSYITLPVLFVMISSHFPSTYNSEFNAVVFLLISVAGALIRHWFIVRHSGEINMWIWPAVAVIGMTLFIITLPASARKAAGPPVSFGQEIKPMIAKHCLSCHSQEPTDPIWKTAPKGVTFDKPEEIAMQSPRIAAFTVASQAMPLGNRTGMTMEEREILGRWIAQGAKIK